MILPNDHTLSHTPNVIRKKLEEMHWRTLEQPAYITELFSLDYHKFGPLREALGYERINDDTTV